ncbi:MAG: hypothetical protein ACYTHJ_10960, partial [Planctomycetota bacterium]
FEQRLEEKLDAAIQCLINLENRSETLVGTAKVTEDHINEAHQTTLAIADRAEQAGVRISSLEDRIRTITERCDQEIERGQNLLHDCDAKLGKIEVVQHSVASSLIEIGAAHEKVTTIRGQVSVCEPLISDLTNCIKRGEKSRAVIEESLARVENANEEWTELAARAEAATANAEAATVKVEDSTARAETTSRELRSEADATMASFHEESRTATEIVRQEINQVRSDWTQIRQEASDAIRSIGAEVETKIGQLDSHNAAARQTIHQLADGTRTAQQFLSDSHGQLVEAEQRIEHVGETMSKVEQMTEDIWALTGRSETCYNQLKEQQEKIEPLIGEMAGHAQGAGAIVDQLNSATARAAEHLATVNQRCEQVDKVAGKLKSASQVLTEVKAQQDVIRESCAKSMEANQQLSKLVDTAGDRIETLGSLASSTSELVERHGDLTEVSNQIAGELAERVDEAKDAGELTVRLISEFECQARTVADAITRLETRAGQIEKHVNAATKKPAAMIETAKVQAAQLERVCVAVRKVFASLSKTSMEARNQSDACSQVSAAATKRVEVLRAESDRLAGTLKEWVGEASRVQGRLERLIERAPSISQTHPGDYLTGLSERLSENPAIPHEEPEGLTMLSEPPVQPGDTISVAESTGEVQLPRTRAEEVSALLADAKKK